MQEASLLVLPGELHLVLATFLTANELKALSQTCTRLQQVYRPASWRNCIVGKGLGELHKGDSTTCFHSLCNYRMVPLAALRSPAKYSWFANESVWYIDSGTYLYSDNFANGGMSMGAGAGGMGAGNRGIESGSVGALSTASDILANLDVGHYPELRSVNIVKGFQLSISNYMPLVASRLFQSSRQEHEQLHHRIRLSVSSFYGVDDTVNKGLRDLEKINVVELRDIRFVWTETPCPPPTSSLVLQHIRLLSIGVLPYRWFEYFVTQTALWPSLRTFIFDRNNFLSIRREGTLVTKRHLLLLQRLPPTVQVCKIVLASAGDREITMDEESTEIAPTAYGGGLCLAPVTDIKLLGSINFDKLSCFIQFPNLRFLDFRGGHSHHSMTRRLDFSTWAGSRLTRLDVSLDFSDNYAATIRNICALPHLEYLQVQKETYPLMSYDLGDLVQTTLMSIYDKGLTDVGAVARDWKQRFDDWSAVASSDDNSSTTSGSAGSADSECLLVTSPANLYDRVGPQIMLGIVQRPLETLDYIHSLPKAELGRPARDVFLEICSVEAFYELLGKAGPESGVLPRLRYLSMCDIYSFKVSLNLQRLLKRFEDAQTPVPGKKELPEMLEQIKLKLFGFLGPISLEPQFGFAPRFRHRVCYQSSPRREHASVLYDVKKQRNLARQFAGLTVKRQDENDESTNIVCAAWELPAYDLFEQEFDEWLY